MENKKPQVITYKALYGNPYTLVITDIKYFRVCLDPNGIKFIISNIDSSDLFWTRDGEMSREDILRMQHIITEFIASDERLLNLDETYLKMKRISVR